MIDKLKSTDPGLSAAERKALRGTEARLFSGVLAFADNVHFLF